MAGSLGVMILQFLGTDHVVETYYVLPSLSLIVIPKVHSYNSHFTDEKNEDQGG